MAAARAGPESGDDMLLDDTARRVEQRLAPVDGGFAAWRLLWAAFMFEGCLWGKLLLLLLTADGQAEVLYMFQYTWELIRNARAGFPMSYGVFQQYYSTLPQFAGNRYIGVVGTIAVRQRRDNDDVLWKWVPAKGCLKYKVPWPAPA
ncbi:hypothetical protein MY1884_002763 [Beauveria asiatica]